LIVSNEKTTNTASNGLFVATASDPVGGAIIQDILLGAVLDVRYAALQRELPSSLI
jgi:hypothetical protein